MGTKLDIPEGGYVIVNNPARLAEVAHTILNFELMSDRFHCQLIEMGVKAYRCNDGWVDRVNSIVTFFAFERERGWYWGNMQLNKGDKIFLGNPSDGGQFAIIDDVAEVNCRYAKYHYHLIDEHIRYGKPKQQSLWSRICDFIAKIL